MKILNKQDLQRIASNNSSDIDFNDFNDFMNVLQSYFLFIDATVVSDNPLHFRKNHQIIVYGSERIF